MLAWTLTFIIPQGAFTRMEDPATGRNVVLPGSYEKVASEPLGFFDLILSVPEGIIERADLIILILLVGGSFYVIEKTGALGQGLQWVVDLLKGRESLALAIVSLLFAIAGLTIGLQEEVIAMAPILILFTRSMGFDAFSALGSASGRQSSGLHSAPSTPLLLSLPSGKPNFPCFPARGSAWGSWCSPLSFGRPI